MVTIDLSKPILTNERLPITIDGGCVPEQNRGNPWFEDGNVILIAGDLAFKVYKGMLSRHSAIFADLFRLPQPKGTSEEMLEGCPIVRLHDSERDLGAFLIALHGGNCRPIPLFLRQDLVVLAGILRMATKYDVRSLRLAAVLPLQQLFPSTLAEWDERLKRRFSPGYASPVIAINLARETSVYQILPAAMAYFVTRASKNMRGRHEDLGLENLQSFLRVKEHCQESIARLMKLVAERGKEDVKRPGCIRNACDVDFVVILRKLCEEMASPDGHASCYQGFVSTMQRLCSNDICVGCGMKMEKEIVKERRRWWEELPIVMGFQGWHDAQLQQETLKLEDHRWIR